MHPAIPLRTVFIIGLLLGFGAGRVPADQVFLATAARAAGAQGTDWRTDVMLFNSGSADLRYTMTYTPSGTDGTASPHIHSGILTPGQAPLLANVVETLFRLADSAGSLRIDADGPLHAASRTYHQTVNGTYGQFVPAATGTDAIASPDDPGLIIGIGQNADHRTNFGFSEVAGRPAVVLLTLYMANGNPLVYDHPIPVPPYSWMQVPLASVHPGELAGGRVEVRVQDGGGSVLAYASVVDNRTGDAVFLPARKASQTAGRHHQMVPVIAKALGAQGTDWRSDLVLSHPYGMYQDLELRYYAGGDARLAIVHMGLLGAVVTLEDATFSLTCWNAAGSAATARMHHAATLLNDGKVLVTGGYYYKFRANVELYSPESGTWTDLGSDTIARSDHTATLLLDGRVLVTGGVDFSGALSTAWLWDPALRTWAATGGMTSPRMGHTASLLPDGRVLVAGGFPAGNAVDPLATSELYDPATGIWTAAGPMSCARARHTATLLSDGRVLTAGGSGSEAPTAAEIFDPASGTWIPTGAMASPRMGFTATLLPDGTVLAAGGHYTAIDDGTAVHHYLSDAELWNPATGMWSPTGSMAEARADFAAARLSDGQVLAVGGRNGGGAGSWGHLSTAELYDPATGTWSRTGSMTTARSEFTTTLLTDGRVLAVGGDEGGWSNSPASRSAELYTFGPAGPSSGTLHFEAPYPHSDYTAVSRTYNRTADGTYGQHIPAMGTEDAIEPGRTGQILMVGQTDAFRCNVGFSEFSGVDSAVHVLLYDEQGNLVASTPQPVQVPAYQNIQMPLTSLFDYSAALPAGRIAVETIGGGSVCAYASIVDDRTGDAIFVPAFIN